MIDYNKFFQSKTFKAVLWGIGGLVLFLLIFGAGMSVGFKKASFSYQWGENYHQNFGGPRGGFLAPWSGRDFIDAHGVTGQIIKIDGNTLVIKGRGDAEKIVALDEKTVIERFRETLKPADLKVDDLIVVIGAPNNAGQIEAKLVRVMPPPPGGMSTSTMPPPPGAPFPGARR